MPSVTIDTHGCKLNQADSQTIEREFSRAGYFIAKKNAPVDIYILNTCTVTHVADKKARQTLRAARRRNPNALIVATGCYVQRSMDEVGSIKEVDLVLNNLDKDTLVRTVTSRIAESANTYATGDAKTNYQPIDQIHQTRAMVKIQEGCDQVCSYCIVPKVRGRERSTAMDSLIAQIKSLEDTGFREIVLTGAQLGTYGFDIPGENLLSLLTTILEQTTVPRIRISSLQPQWINDDLLDLWRNPRLCPHFHIPLQSGSNSVLKRMRRRYTSEDFAITSQLIRSRVPDVSITTDVIAGFPGESQEEFQETYDLCKLIKFSDMHVFPYSKRPGTSAAYLVNQVDDTYKARRVEMLIELMKEFASLSREKHLNQTRQVLWESVRTLEGRRQWSGLTDTYQRVYADDNRNLINTITDTEILRHSNGYLWSEAH